MQHCVEIDLTPVVADSGVNAPRGKHGLLLVEGENLEEACLRYRYTQAAMEMSGPLCIISLRHTRLGKPIR